MPGPAIAAIGAADVACLIAGVGLGTWSTITSGPGQDLTEHVASLGVGGVCAISPGGGVAFAGGYTGAVVVTDSALIIVKLMSAENSTRATDNTDAVMQLLFIDKKFYRNWSFFSTRDEMDTDIIRAWNDGYTYKAGFAIQTCNGIVYFTLSEVARDFLKANSATTTAFSRRAASWMYVSMLAGGPGTPVGDKRPAKIADLVRTGIFPPASLK